VKIIDLLNKIANGEEVPYKIKYNERIFEYAEEIKWYLRDDMKCELSNSKKCLNDEVKIIEEDKKIKKLEYDEHIVNDLLIADLYTKINEIIDKLNKED
jgi:hypothetical protein